MPDQRIAFIMATRNSAAYIRESVESVLGQGDPLLDFIVVDAASTDGTRDYLAGIDEIRVIDQDGTGLWQAWNQAIALTDAPLIGSLDSDDLLQPGAIAAHRRALEAGSGALASIGRVRFFLDGEEPPPGFRRELLIGSHAAHMAGATLCRRSAFDIIGPYPEDLTTAADIDWFLRLRQSGHPIADIDDVVLAKRVHPGNLGGEFLRGTAYDRDVLRIARESLARRRRGAEAEQS